MEERKKASDIFQETNYVFSSKVPFREAFPEIKDIEIVCTEKGYLYGGGHDVRNHNYSNDHLPGEFIDCGNSLCYAGGFSIGNVIRSMVGNKEVSKKGHAICEGNEGSPKGKRIYRKCTNFFEYEVKISYK